jgi:hypothetical protein
MKFMLNTPVATSIIFGTLFSVIAGIETKKSKIETFFATTVIGSQKGKNP